MATTCKVVGLEVPSPSDALAQSKACIDTDLEIILRELMQTGSETQDISVILQLIAGYGYQYTQEPIEQKNGETTLFRLNVMKAESPVATVNIEVTGSEKERLLEAVTLLFSTLYRFGSTFNGFMWLLAASGQLEISEGVFTQLSEQYRTKEEIIEKLQLLPEVPQVKDTATGLEISFEYTEHDKRYQITFQVRGEQINGAFKYNLVEIQETIQKIKLLGEVPPFTIEAVNG